ncbi:UvrD-helicase domain-containing protein [Halomonas ramblicola]|uniref:UvrD-helicase domain-containing protein n=1 Tax=Halomonas ramblicola TaxID=747349 RepID=UPI0025B2D933|nr:ATP-dependent helicase [Halomonas ramblicola]MDN3521472.1 ATP-dependent helicase [Halomonas ramblicola]
MDSQKLDPVDKILSLVEGGSNFVLQGGAGSGKTESLKQVVHALMTRGPGRKIICITHTNKAAEEIQDRVEADIDVSTIHSFLSSLIKPFGRNIKVVFPELFLLERFEAYDLECYEGNERERNKEEHERFKKAHKALEDRRTIVLGQATGKVVGKRAYDKNRELYNAELDALIVEVNDEIHEQVRSRRSDEFFYNETIFNNFSDPSFGHDGLLIIAALLFEQYPLLRKIIADRYDCIFIDEYQDTNAAVIRSLLRGTTDSQAVIGLFGDSEQAIYEDGIGSAQKHIDAEELVLVEKGDNYRCSPQVIKVANQFRTDGLQQDIALKWLEDGTFETAEERNGEVLFYYALAPEKPETGNERQDKVDHAAACVDARDALVGLVADKYPEYTQLKLTNKSIAQDVGFGTLYDVFNKRFSVDPRDRLKKFLDRLQMGEVYDLIQLFKSMPSDRRAYNRLIAKLRKNGFAIRSVKDKKGIEDLLTSLAAEDLGAYDTVKFAIENNLVRPSDSHRAFLDRRQTTLERMANDPVFLEFEALQSQGNNTLPRMKRALPDADLKVLDEATLEERFTELEKDLREKRFLEGLFSSALEFSEVAAYYRYEDDDATFATMHKTKGTGIENVMIVLDEYSWRKYDFLSCFSGEQPASDIEASTRKLLYVACSRAKKNLICVRLVQDEKEANKIGAFFPSTQQVQP